MKFKTFATGQKKMSSTYIHFSPQNKEMVLWIDTKQFSSAHKCLLIISPILLHTPDNQSFVQPMYIKRNFEVTSRKKEM